MMSAANIEKQQKYELERLLTWAGSKARLADALNISRQTVYYWIKRGRISATCAIEVEKITKGLFTKEELRPDVINWSEK